MKILVTGAAGFIGFHLSLRLLEMGYKVYGIDNLNDYYDKDLKIARLSILDSHKAFSFKNIDISIFKDLETFVSSIKPEKIVHLAAQAGVRFSITDPQNYVYSNLVGHSNILEISRKFSTQHLIYASSSSVYGDSSSTPYKETEIYLNPESFYAATKLSCEILTQSYTNLYGILSTGLRFFTVYGPWGRPDMAYYSFTKKIINNDHIQIYGNGESLRDFTYIDDITEGILRLLEIDTEGRKIHEIYNIGKSNPISVNHLVKSLEDLLQKKATIEYVQEQKGDVKQTFADVSKLADKIGYFPRVELEEGLTYFVDWYKEYHH